MIKTLTLGCALIGAVFASDVTLPQDTAPNRSTKEFVIDGGHSSVMFRVSHIKASMFWGMFNDISGSLKVDDDNLDQSFIKMEVATESIDTRSEGRDRHLKSQDFFAAKEFPKMSFESTKVEKTGEGTYEVTGDLTLRGVTKSITFPAEHTGTATVSERFGLRCGYEATLEIDRTDFGISYGADGGVLGRTVRIIVAIEGKLAG